MKVKVYKCWVVCGGAEDGVLALHSVHVHWGEYKGIGKRVQVKDSRCWGNCIDTEERSTNGLGTVPRDWGKCEATAETVEVLLGTVYKYWKVCTNAGREYR